MNTDLDDLDESFQRTLPPGADATDWELAAAGYELAMLTADDAARGTMPPAIAARIASEAPGFLPRPRGGGTRPASTAGGALPIGGSPMTVAAASLAALLAVAVAWRAWTGLRDEVPKGGVAGPCPSALAPAELRRRLLAEDPDVLTVAWRAGNDPSVAVAAGGTAPHDLGDVVWSPGRRQGFLRISGLAANEPTVEQYQLWIFDADGKQATPVDGGVFDVGPGGVEGEIVVTMRPRRPIGRATLFIVTVERPGGVEVSGRKRLALVAAVP